MQQPMDTTSSSTSLISYMLRQIGCSRGIFFNVEFASQPGRQEAHNWAPAIEYVMCVDTVVYDERRIAHIATYDVD